MRRTRVLIAGGGVAGLETLLALRALTGDRLDITIVAPDRRFVNRSMSVDQPFQTQRTRGIELEEMAAEFGAHWHRGALDRIELERRRVVTSDRAELPYDRLVLALGARAEPEWDPAGVLTYHGGQDGSAYRLLLHQLKEGRCSNVAFVKPAGATWPLPLYDFALMTAAHCATPERSDVELSLVTPEGDPLGMFGHAVSAAVRRLLRDTGVNLHTSSYGVPRRAGRLCFPSRPGWLDITPGKRAMRADRIVTEPRLLGPRLRGIRCGRDGFIHADAHGRVDGMEDVFAAGDATDFPIKQGGLAAQQADAVAETIAASVGFDIEPRPFRPVLRGVLLTGGGPRYLRSDISGDAGDDSVISTEALWWPPDKLAGRYLGPYLSTRIGRALDVMPQEGQGFPGTADVDLPGPLGPSGLCELSDLTPARMPR